MKPGDIFLTRFGGPWGLPVTLAQGLTGDWSRFCHAGVIVDHDELVEAEPGGAVVSPLSSLDGRSPLAVLPAPEWADHDAIVAEARRLVGTPYGWASYAWIGLSKLGIHPRWLRNEVASTRSLICSALADRAWLAGGVHAFNDGRLLGEVTPGDLAYVGRVENINAGPWRLP